MKRNVFSVLVTLLLLIALTPFNVIAQHVLNGVYVKEHIPTRRVVPYAPLREADVMWSKRIWRTIVLSEKMNLPLKYPSTASTKDRKSLIDVIHDAVLEGTLTSYNANIDDEFTTPLTQAEAAAIGIKKGDTIPVIDPTTQIETMKIIPDEPLNRDNVVKFRLIEDWFFDKQRSVMDVRIIGIAPVMLKVSEESGEAISEYALYWVYFPEARKIFVNNEVFNRFNDAERRSFDDIFMKRMFASFIIKESNVYNRRIQDYKTNPLDQLLEANKIKEDIFYMEHDVWEY